MMSDQPRDDPLIDILRYIERDVAELKQDMAGLKTGIDSLLRDMSELRTAIRSLRSAGAERPLQR